ncbi:unnamed protein product [Merluccius merluccius]
MIWSSRRGASPIASPIASPPLTSAARSCVSINTDIPARVNQRFLAARRQILSPSWSGFPPLELVQDLLWKTMESYFKFLHPAEGKGAAVMNVVNHNKTMKPLSLHPGLHPRTQTRLGIGPADRSV